MEFELSSASLYTIKGVIILDNNGERILGKYYDSTFPSVLEQRAFEKKLFQTTQKQSTEIVMFDGLTVVYKSSVDIFLYVLGSQQENELILCSALDTFFDAMSQILKKNVEKRYLMDRMDAVLLVLDEMVDGGVLMDIDASGIVKRVIVKSEVEVPFAEQSMDKIFQSVKSSLPGSIKK